MRRLTLLLLLALCPALGSAKSAAASEALANQIGLELGGEATLASAHYERLVYTRNDTIHVLARVGLGYFPVYINGQAAPGAILAPIGLHCLYGTGAHHLDAGLSVTSIVALDDAGRDEGLLWGGYLTPSLGYRFSDFTSGRWALGLAYSPRLSEGVMGIRYDHYVRAEIGVLF